MNRTLSRKRIRASVPWWAKGALKLSLSRIPIKYSVRRSLALSRHGGMERPAYAFDIFQRHFTGADFHRKQTGGFTLLEMGPGDSLFSAVIAKAHGASACWLVDVDSCASTDVSLYRDLAEFLKARHLPSPEIAGARSIAEVLTACNATYEIRGLDSLRGLDARSVDFMFSNSVLQAIRRDCFLDTLLELRRIIHPGGCCIHSIDLRDMMSFSLHHLRFSERLWESDLIRRSGFYTNRLRLWEILQMCRAAGFDTEISELRRWDALPIERSRMAAPFRNMTDDDLLPATIRIAMRPRPLAAPLAAPVAATDALNGAIR